MAEGGALVEGLEDVACGAAGRGRASRRVHRREVAAAAIGRLRSAV